MRSYLLWPILENFTYYLRKAFVFYKTFCFKVCLIENLVWSLSHAVEITFCNLWLMFFSLLSCSSATVIYNHRNRKSVKTVKSFLKGPWFFISLFVKKKGCKMATFISEGDSSISHFLLLSSLRSLIFFVFIFTYLRYQSVILIYLSWNLCHNNF